MSTLRAGSADGASVDVPAAVSELYRAHRLALLRTATFLCGDQSIGEDLVQEAFVALQRNWDGLRSSAAALAYLRTCVVNGSRNVHRRASVMRRHLRVAEPETGPGADYALLVSEEHREVLAALRTLPTRQREVLVLRYWSELDQAQIAAAMGISPGTVKSTASRALAALESALKGAK